MANRWVVVFGCSGFVGSHITRALLQKGYSVRGTCRNPIETKNRFVFFNIKDNSDTPHNTEFLALKLTLLNT